MGFDVQNFGLGLLSGWATAYGVYRARHLIRRTLDTVSQGATSAQDYAVQTRDTRYIRSIIRYAERQHIAGHLLPLSQIVVEPRFIPAPSLAAPVNEDDEVDVFRVVPHVPEFPHFLAPYHVHTFSLRELANGDRRLALLGTLGSGRTTALLTILLHAAGHATFQAPEDRVQQRQDAEDAALDDRKRAVRLQERLLLEQRARERLVEERGKAQGDEAAGGSRFNRLLPIYIHLSDLVLPAAGSSADPAEPLVRAVQRQLGPVSATTAPATLYERLGAGQALVLVDGLDELPENEQQAKTGWLAALLEHYPDNFYIVSGPAIGHGLLTERLGLLPVYLRPWSRQDALTSIQRWLSTWSGSRSKNRKSPDETTVEALRLLPQGYSPLELTLRTWRALADGRLSATLHDALDSLIRSSLSPLKPEPVNAWSILVTLGRLQTEQGLISAADAATILMEPVEEGKKAAPRRSPLAVALLQQGLLRRRGAGHLQFSHPLLAAYLTSRALAQEPESIPQRALDPRWQTSLALSAGQLDLEDMVRERLAAVDDILNTGLSRLAQWVAYAPVDAEWRKPVLRQLSRLFSAPTQYPLVRERAAAALVASRAPEAAEVFRNALGSGLPHVRQIACLGLGAIGDEDSADRVTECLKDESPEVQLAAVLALGALRGETALTGLVEALGTASDPVRQAAAEMAADNPEQGYELLYEGLQDQDMFVRRASIFGVRRLQTGWAALGIYRAFLEDSQWYVRSAAQLAFEEMRFGSSAAPRRPPQPENIQWLNEWAADKGLTVQPGPAAYESLGEALRTGESPIRVIAAASVGPLAARQLLRDIYTALRDPDAAVRAAAHRSLVSLQSQHGLALPQPT